MVVLECGFSVYRAGLWLVVGMGWMDGWRVRVRGRGFIEYRVVCGVVLSVFLGG